MEWESSITSSSGRSQRMSFFRTLLVSVFHAQLFRTLQKAVAARLVHCASVDTFLCQPVSGWTPLPAHCPFPLHSVGYSTQSTADTTRGVRETPCVRKPSRTQWSSCFFFWLLSTHKRSALRIQKKGGLRTPREGDSLFDISNEKGWVFFFLVQHALRISRRPGSQRGLFIWYFKWKCVGSESLVCCCATTMLVVVVDDDESNQNLSLPLLLLTLWLGLSRSEGKQR